jgi:hypothetical protein
MADADRNDGRLALDEARALAGNRLDGIEGKSVGRVEGVLVAADSERPEWLLARMGRFGHHTLIPARDAVEGVGHVWVPYTRDQVRGAPRIEPGSSLKGNVERELLAHYGIAGDSGRFAEIARHDGEAITAHPAD